MVDYKYLQEMSKIAPENRFPDYIAERVASDDYRGMQCSQHNRLTFDYFSKLVSVIYDIAGNSVFGIHIGDDNGVLQPQAYTYYRIVEAIHDAVGKGTINSVKKNTFPDIARMGFLHRYDRHGKEIAAGSARGGVYSVGCRRLASDLPRRRLLKRSNCSQMASMC